MARGLKFLFVVSLLLSLAAPCFASPDKFQVIYRQEEVLSDDVKTSANLLVNVVNLSEAEAKDVTVSIPVQNSLLAMDMPVLIGTIPGMHQAERLQKVQISNDTLLSAEPEENIVWRIEFINEAGERELVDIKGTRGI